MTDNAPNGRGFVTLLQAFRASGGTAPADIVSRLLDDHHAGEAVSLARLIHADRVFGFEWRGSLWIPMFQFNRDDLSITPAPQAVRAELPELWSGWTVANWFAMPNARLEWQRPVDQLSSDFAAVVQAAQSLPLSEDMAFLPVRRTRERSAHA